MSEQEFITPEQKHRFAEWKCPICGEDGVWNETHWWKVAAPGRIPLAYDYFRAEVYWCEYCPGFFEGDAKRASAPPLEELP